MSIPPSASGVGAGLSKRRGDPRVRQVKSSPMLRRVRNVMFTIQNPTEEMKQRLKYLCLIADQDAEVTDPKARQGKVRYIIFQLERATTGTLHVQGYLELFNPMKGTMILEKVLQGQAHLEQRRGTAAQARAYCRKMDTAVFTDDTSNPRVKEFEGVGGVASQQGKKRGDGTDSVDNVVQMVADGIGIEEIMEENRTTDFLHHEKLCDFFNRHKGVRNLKPSDFKVKIYWGPSGCGKTYTAREKYGASAYFIVSPGSQWWFPNYQSQTTCVYNEFKGQVKYTDLIQMLDLGPWVVQRKGGNLQFLGSKIIFTTTLHPSLWYPGMTAEKKVELRRRLREYATIYEFQAMDTSKPFPEGIKFEKKKLTDFEWTEQSFASTNPDAGLNYGSGWDQ